MELRLEPPSTARDYELWATILEQVSGDVVDVDEIVHFVESDTEGAWLLATIGDEPAGCGVGRPSSIQSSMYAMVRVLPEHRGQGIGNRIYEVLSEHAQRLGRDSMWGRILEDDEESRSFARNRGFREAGREYEVVLDTAQADIVADPPEGIELVSLAERPDLAEAVHAVDCEVLGRRSPARGRRLRAPAIRQMARALPRRPRRRPGRADRGARRKRGRRLHGPAAPRRDLADRGEPAHRGPPPVAQARHRGRAQAGADREGARRWHRADLHDERRDERRHARRQCEARLPPRPDADRRERAPRYVMSRRRVSTTARAPSTPR